MPGAVKVIVCCAGLLLMLVLMADPLLGPTDNNSKAAYADGGDRVEIPASFEGRSATLLVKISPAVLTSDNIQDASVLFRLYDTQTNETFKFVSLFLFISKDDKMLIPPDLYHSREGILKLKIQPSPGEAVIYANKEPHLDAWEADYGGVINLKGPLLLKGGLYRIHIEVFGIKNPLTIFPQDEIPKFDAYLSVGDVYDTHMNSQNKIYNVTIVSYYDYVKDFSFDQDKKEFAWTMPFNYNLTRIENEGDVFIHQELRIPWSLTEITDNLSFVGTADGVRLRPSSVALDPYTSESQLFVHLLIDKSQIIQVVKDSPQIDTPGTMKFTLSPTKAAERQTSTTVYSDTGILMATLSWTPSQLTANTPVELTLKFYDRFSNEPVTGDVKYDLVVYPSGIPERTPAIRMDGNVASNGTDTVRNLAFPADGIYDFEIRFNDISQPTSASPDPSRAGRALGVVVVPEFSSAMAGTILVAFVTSIVIALRTRHS